MVVEAAGRMPMSRLRVRLMTNCTKTKKLMTVGLYPSGKWLTFELWTPCYNVTVNRLEAPAILLTLIVSTRAAVLGISQKSSNFAFPDCTIVLYLSLLKSVI